MTNANLTTDRAKKIFSVLDNEGVFEVFEILLEMDKEGKKARNRDLIENPKIKQTTTIKTSLPILDDAKLIRREQIYKNLVYYSFWDEGAKKIVEELVKIKKELEK